VYAVKAYWGVKVYFHSFIIFPSDGGEWPALPQRKELAELIELEAGWTLRVGLDVLQDR